MHTAQPPHGDGHLADSTQDFACRRARPGRLPLVRAEALQVFRRVLLRCEHRPQHGPEKRRCSQIERRAHGERNRVGITAALRHVEDVGQQPGQCRRDDRTQPNQQALHGEAAGALSFRQQVRDKCAKRLHADVDGGIQNPQHRRRKEQRLCARHQQQGDGAQDGTSKEIWAAAAQRSPRAVTHVPNERLHQQAGERRGQPQDWDLVGMRTQVLIDGAHVGLLQTPAKLDAKETKAHVEDLRAGLLRLAEGGRRGRH